MLRRGAQGIPAPAADAAGGLKAALPSGRPLGARRLLLVRRRRPITWTDPEHARVPDSENLLIGALPEEERRRLLARSVRVALLPSQVLCAPGEELAGVYFIANGLVSLVAPIDGVPGPEVGMVGREGMLGAQLALGVDDTALYAVVQCPTQAWRVDADEFRALLSLGGELPRVLQRFAHGWSTQVAICAACLRFHQIEPRLARWLLMSHDRVQDGALHVTHETLAQMLGVRRVGVTRAAGELQRRGLIEYRYGQVRVLDRAGLEQAACSCYGLLRPFAPDEPVAE